MGVSWWSGARARGGPSQAQPPPAFIRSAPAYALCTHSMAATLRTAVIHRIAGIYRIAVILRLLYKSSAAQGGGRQTPVKPHIHSRVRMAGTDIDIRMYIQIMCDVHDYPKMKLLDSVKRMIDIDVDQDRGMCCWHISLNFVTYEPFQVRLLSLHPQASWSDTML